MFTGGRSTLRTSAARAPVSLWASTFSRNTANNVYTGAGIPGGGAVYLGKHGMLWAAADIFNGPCRSLAVFGMTRATMWGATVPAWATRRRRERWQPPPRATATMVVPTKTAVPRR